MDNTGGEEGRMERRSNQGEDETTLKEMAEDMTATVPPEDLTRPESEDLARHLHPVSSGADENSPSTNNSDDAAQMLAALHLSNLNTSEDMEDEQPLQKEEEEEEEEEEELVVLDPEHPLVRKQQAALSKHLRKQLERINLDLKEKLVQEKDDDRHREEIGVEMFRVQEQLARLHSKLEEHHQTKEQAEVKHRQAQEQLEAVKSQHSTSTSQQCTAKASVSRLQTETDDLTLHLVFTQRVSEELQSNVKALKNVRSRAAAEKNQAEDQKLKQDLYLEHLTKDLERLTQQIDTYDAQASVQAEETREAKQAHAEAEMEMESLVMVRKHLLQQWKSSLVDMRRRNEAFNAATEALRMTEHQVILQHREVESYKKSISEAQEQNETLTLQLNWAQMDGATTRKLMSQKQAQLEALQSQYSTCVRILRETERTLAWLTKETGGLQAEANNQRRQLEKESATRLESEDRILSHMQQQLTHNKAAKYSQQLISKTAALKKQKMSQLWQLENELLAVELESSEVGEHLDSLAVVREALDEEMTEYNNALTSSQNKMSACVRVIEQRQNTITNLNRRIGQIAASTGHEDLSPLQIKVEALSAQTEELAARMKREQQLWMKQQGVLVGLTQDIEANSRSMLKLKTEHTVMQQKKLRLEKQMEAEHQELTELEKNVKTLRGDLLKLNTLLSKNGQLSQTLEQENMLMETDFLHRLKEAERESVEMQMKVEKTAEEKERLLNSLVEAERQIMLWEKKIQLVKETRSAVDSEVGHGEIHMMKAEIHRMEVRLNQLRKQQEQLVRESEATVARREVLVVRREVMVHSSHRQTSKGDLSRLTQGLQRKIRDSLKHVTECERGIRELQESQVSLSDRLSQQKQQLMDLSSTGYSLDQDLANLQDTKDRNVAHLVALQGRIKRLQGVREGSYQALSTSESVDVALQSQIGHVHATSSVLRGVCEDFPQHQESLHRLTSSLAAQTLALDQEAA